MSRWHYNLWWEFKRRWYVKRRKVIKRIEVWYINLWVKVIPSMVKIFLYKQWKSAQAIDTTCHICKNENTKLYADKHGGYVFLCGNCNRMYGAKECMMNLDVISFTEFRRKCMYEYEMERKKWQNTQRISQGW
jgi:hypothetical protein